MLIKFSKNLILTSGGLLLLFIYLFFGVILLYGKGKVLRINLNLSNSPYFSFIGNLGSSRKSFVESITPEC